MLCFLTFYVKFYFSFTLLFFNPKSIHLKLERNFFFITFIIYFIDRFNTHIFILGVISLDNNFNIDKNTMNKLNDMIKKGDLSDIISNIPPDVMENFSSMMNSTSNSNSNNSSNNNSSSNSNQNSFDFSNIDMNTIMKVKNIMDKMNSANDSRSNLLASLKPYLRDEKKEKLDQYTNLMNFAKLAEIFKNDTNKES